MIFKKEVAYMRQLMKEAAEKEIMPRFKKVEGTDKGGGHYYDPVTEADLGASQYILDRIRPDFPGSYSEEHKHPDRFNHDLIWQLDPVDGTHEFVEGIADGFAVQAALLQRQPDNTFEAVASIVYLPAVDKWAYTNGSGEVILEIKGEQKKIAPPDRNEVRGFIRGVDQCPKLPQTYHDIGQSLDIPGRAIACGGAGAGLIDMLEGKINILIFSFNISKDWDISIFQPMMDALGGFVCDVDGKPFTYNRPDDQYGQPHNLRGTVMSYSFKPEEIIPHLPEDIILDKLS